MQFWTYIINKQNTRGELKIGPKTTGAKLSLVNGDSIKRVKLNIVNFGW